jgi:hypothetical protein
MVWSWGLEGRGPAKLSRWARHSAALVCVCAVLDRSLVFGAIHNIYFFFCIGLEQQFVENPPRQERHAKSHAQQTARCPDGNGAALVN